MANHEEEIMVSSQLPCFFYEVPIPALMKGPGWLSARE